MARDAIKRTAQQQIGNKRQQNRDDSCLTRIVRLE